MLQYPYLLYKQEFKLKSKRVIIQQGEKEQLNSLQLLYAQLQLDSFEQFDTAEQKNVSVRASAEMSITTPYSGI